MTGIFSRGPSQTLKTDSDHGQKQKANTKRKIMKNITKTKNRSALSWNFYFFIFLLRRLSWARWDCEIARARVLALTLTDEQKEQIIIFVSARLSSFSLCFFLEQMPFFHNFRFLLISACSAMPRKRKLNQINIMLWKRSNDQAIMSSRFYSSDKLFLFFWSITANEGLLKAFAQAKEGNTRVIKVSIEKGNFGQSLNISGNL